MSNADRNADRIERFFEACGKGDVDALRGLLAEDQTLARATNPRAPHRGWTGLHDAARRERLDVVRLLLAHGADPNAREAGDNTYPLHWAAAAGNLEIARALVEAGGDVHGRGDLHELDTIGWATFYHAEGEDASRLQEARRPLVAWLVERGAAHHIISAICVGDLELIRDVVRQDPNALGRRTSSFDRGLTPLHLAISRKRDDIVDLLIELGADLEATDKNGQTPLAAAMLHGDRGAMERLRAAGAALPTMSARPATAATSETPAMSATSAMPAMPATSAMSAGPAMGEGDALSVRAGMAALAASVKKNVPMIRVPEIARTLDWYVSIGFKELGRFEDDGVVNFGIVSFGGAEVMFNVQGKTGAHDVSLWFYTDKIDELYHLLKSRQLHAMQAGEPGIAFEQELEEMFYGARQFGIRDINGYELYFIQSTN